MEMSASQDLETRLQAADDADAAEAEQMRAAAVQASTYVVRDHLRDYLARNPGASYEAWIAALHPENVEVDSRLRIGGNPWLVAWAEAGTAARIKEVCWLHGCLTVFSAAWAGLCIFMHRSGSEIVTHTTVAMGMATTLSVILFFVQVAVFFATFYLGHRHSLPRHVYKVNVGQLLVQTCVTIIGLTCFIFNQHGLALFDCLKETGCVTSLKGKGFGKDALQWRELNKGGLLGGPFSSVDIVVDREKIDGNRLPKTNLTNNGELWDGIRIQAAVPLKVSYTTVDKAVIYMTMILYGLAAINTLLYVVTCRRPGQPGWLSLKRMECVACCLCLLLIFMNIWGFALHPQSPFVAPVFIGCAMLVTLISHVKANLGRRHFVVVSFNQFQKRTVTAQAVGVMVAFTYMAGLCDSIILCSSAGIWPNSLDIEDQHIFIWGSLFHLLLSAGYAVSLWANLYLMRLRSVSHVQNQEGTAGIAQATRQPPATPVPPMPPSSGANEEAQEDCAVCMDGPRDTVFVPCGHIALCNACARNIMQSRRPLCPICNHAVEDLCRVYRA